MTPQILAPIMGCPLALAQLWAEPLTKAMELYHIDNKMRQAMFLAHTGTESAGLTVLVENLNYSVEALLSLFGRHRITEAEAKLYGRSRAHPADQEALANILYGGEWGRKNLGNTQPGDGWLFRGHGAKQITGRANTAFARDSLRVKLGVRVPNFEAEPHLLCTPEWGSYSAADFWNSRDLNLLADRGDIEGVTRKINGGLNGLEDRRTRYARASGLLA